MLRNLSKQLVEALPYGESFRFVDEITTVSDSYIEGAFTFKKELAFYQSHFKDHPVTPGVILTECMAQIGLVCFGIYLMNITNDNEVKIKEVEKLKIAFSESHVIFEKAVYPDEKVFVRAEKIYWRLGKLKCKVEMHNFRKERVCYGEMSGMIKT